ncbi:MAG TPA: hypothetical protein VN914_02705 [Polyangia bacterium]|jgi:hypothetical protein|nr:hypothetical protein [Polyangia bacterium]
MSAVVVLLSLLTGGPVIRADADGCPEAAAISQRLAGLLNSGADPAEPDQVDLSLDGSDLRLRLSRADGTLVAERRIPRSNRCPELADAVAALVAAWEADLRPEAPAPVVTPRPPPRPVAPLAVEEAAPAPAPPIYELGVLPALWVGAGRLSFAGALRAGVWSRRSPVGATLAFSSIFPVEGSSAGWRRHALSAGVMGRMRHRWLFVDALGEAVVGWVVTEEASGSKARFDPGLTIGLRAGSRVARRLELYLSVGAWGAAWPSTDPENPGAMPHWGLLTGFGGSFLFGT